MNSNLIQSRLTHIDIMRAIAILFMIEVHAAATFQPSNISIESPFALLAAMIGGMAAPLFVTISGWGTHRSLQRRLKNNNHDLMRWVVIRVVVLILCQFLVNIISYHLFEWHTPGVLSLLAICALTSVAITRLSIKIRLLLLILISISPLIIAEYFIINLSWSTRISSPDLFFWISRVFVSGTYPLFPWLSFFILGGLISDFSKNSRVRIGLLFGGAAIFILLFALINNLTWALTSGDALLTFFPASMPFIITAIAGVLLIHEILLTNIQWNEKSILYRGFIHMGSLSLTIYVLHFIPFSLYELSGIDAKFNIFHSFIIIITYTIMWWFFAILHLKYCKNISLEFILRKLSN